ncbi:MAG: hypothetical protein EOP05_02255 [Proteobacteria bacterium]|nr:MAG: hypothetical protein EOP05_02255 [Pseudomonadota bacterium]
MFFEAKEKGFFKVIDGYEEKHHRLYGYQSPYHEAAAFVVSELFGFGVVPPTFMRTLTLPGQLSPKLGSVQRYIEGQTPKQLATRKGIYIEPSKLMRIFDLLIGNVDRSEGNYVITKDNQQWAIDNAAAFQTSNSLKANLDDTAKGPELRDRISSMLSEHPLVLLRLKTTSDAQIKSALGMLLMPAQIKYLIARKNTLVSVAKQQRQSF